MRWYFQLVVNVAKVFLEEVSRKHKLIIGNDMHFTWSLKFNPQLNP